MPYIINLGRSALLGLTRLRFLIACSFLVACSFVVACSDPVEVSDSLGEWGGEGVAALIEANSVSFEFDCAHASVPEGLTFDETGNFEVSGIWVSEGGPVPIDPPDELDAVFRGFISGTFMRLEVDIIPRDVTAGPYELRRGQSPILRKCL